MCVVFLCVFFLGGCLIPKINIEEKRRFWFEKIHILPLSLSLGMKTKKNQNVNRPSFLQYIVHNPSSWKRCKDVDRPHEGLVYLTCLFDLLLGKAVGY